MDYEIMRLENELYKRLGFNFDEDDLDLQEEYFKIVNKIIDGTLLVRYNIYKEENTLSSKAKINDFVLSHFERISSNNIDDILEELEENICFFVNMYYEGEKYGEVVRQLFTIYKENNRSLPPEKTNDIYNDLLNEQQDLYVSENRKSVLQNIKENIPLTDKKKTLLIINEKMKIARTLIEFKNFDQLKVDEEEIMKSLQKLCSYLNSIKPFNKKENALTEEQLNYFTYLFLNNTLDSEVISKKYPNIPKDAIKKIVSKYNQILIPYLKNIEIDKNKLDYRTVEFNHNHLKLVNRESYNKNLSELISRTNKEEKRFLLSHIEALKDVLNLLPLVTILPNDDFLNIDTFKSMLMNYDKIKSMMIKQNTIREDSSFEEILDNFREFLRLAIVYKQADINTVSILGEKRVEIITLNNKLTSCNSYDYVNTYIEMLKEDTSFLPPLSFEIEIEGNYYKVESGNNYDLDRLLLGKNVVGSCIGPNCDGQKAFYQCLTKKNADLCLIKEANTNDFFARIIMFRLGNAIIMAPIYGKDGITRELYNEEFLTVFCEQMVKKSITVGDNIEYIVIAGCLYIDKRYESLNTDDNIEKYVPHCDISSSLKIIFNINKNIDIDYHIEPKIAYRKERRKVVVKEENYLTDIMRLRALDKIMTSSNENLQEEVCEYQKVYIGQDFYIALKENDTIDSVILPINSDRQKNEINVCIEDIINKLDIDENDLKRISFTKK